MAMAMHYANSLQIVQNSLLFQSANKPYGPINQTIFQKFVTPAYDDAERHSIHQTVQYFVGS